MYSPLTTQAIAQGMSPNTIRQATGDVNIKKTEVPLSPFAQQWGGGDDRRKTFSQRAFSKLEKGSLRGSIINLCNAAIGGGVLSLPYVFVISGWLTGLILMLVGGFAGIWSNLMIARLAIDTKLNNLDKIVKSAGGKKLQVLMTVMVLLYLTGVCIGYQIIMTQMIQYVTIALGTDEEFVNSWQFRTYVGVPAAAFVFFPLSMLRDMSSLSYASLAAIAALAYSGLVLIIECPF